MCLGTGYYHWPAYTLFGTSISFWSHYSKRHDIECGGLSKKNLNSIKNEERKGGERRLQGDFLWRGDQPDCKMNIKKLPPCVCEQEGWWYVIGQCYLEKEWVKRQWTRKRRKICVSRPVHLNSGSILEWRCMSIVIMAVASKQWSSSIRWYWISFAFSPHHRSFSSRWRQQTLLI